MMTDFDTSFVILIVLGILLFTLIVIHMYRKRKRIIARLQGMSYSEKCNLINSIVDSLGYQYICSDDIFSTKIDAWQKEFGYMALYDAGAPFFNMIFDCEPVYFDYRGQTWLIEFWKGQYGINVGGEIGIYHSDRLLAPKEYKTELFQTVDTQDFMELSMSLHFHNNFVLLSRKHWWLTVFCMGTFAHPKDIDMTVLIRFPNNDMLWAFRNAMLSIGYKSEELLINGTDLFFIFTKSHTRRPGFLSRFHRMLVQQQNRLFCKLFTFITRPQKSAMDRLLFLYYHMPSAFRHTMNLRHQKKKLSKK